MSRRTVPPGQPGRTVRNGYGKAHKRLRAEIAARMRAGEVFSCWRCRRPIMPGSPWDLGHDDRDRSIYRGPEHRGRECPAGGNRATYKRRARKLSASRLRRWVL